MRWRSAGVSFCNVVRCRCRCRCRRRLCRRRLCRRRRRRVLGLLTPNDADKEVGCFVLCCVVLCCLLGKVTG